MLSIFSLVAFAGCSAATDTSNAPYADRANGLEQTYTECAAPEGYDSCLKLEFENALTWQESVASGEPAWRTLSEDEEGTPVVEIDALRLNAGIIPTAEGQGHYEDEEDFVNTMVNLLGLPEPNIRFKLVVTGATAKMDSDREALSDASTGSFVYDALSDENGEIFIAGENVSDELMNGGIDPLPVDDETTSSSTTTASQSLKKFGAGNASAKMNAFRTLLPWYAVVGTTTKKFRRNGKHSRLKLTWNGIFPEVRRIQVVANEIKAVARAYDTDKPKYDKKTKARSDARHVQVGIFAIGAGNFFAPNHIPSETVCGVGSFIDDTSSASASEKQGKSEHSCEWESDSF